LEPQLGVVEIRERSEFDVKSFVMADIPGLIEGASQGRGLGHEFLKHLERTKVIAYVLDAFPVDGVDPLETFELLRGELRAYDEKFSAKKAVVVLNKADLAEGEDGGAATLDSLKQKITDLGYSAFVISAATSSGLTDLKRGLFELVKDERRKFELELASRLPVVKGLMSAASLGLQDHGMLSFRDAMSDGRVFSRSTKRA
jgi:GTP-binding protein